MGDRSIKHRFSDVPHPRISTLSRRSSFTDTPPSSTMMLMIQVVLAVATLLAVAEGKCYWSDYTCNEKHGCSYGCVSGFCFTQCNRDSGDGKNCKYMPQWCSLDSGKGSKQSCSKDSDCFNVRYNDCYDECEVKK